MNHNKSRNTEALTTYLLILSLVFSLSLISTNTLNVSSCSGCSENQIEWFRVYKGDLRTGASSIIQTTDGGFVVSGNDYVDEFDDNVLLIKTDSEGMMIWNQTFGGLGSDRARQVVQTSDGGFALAGSTSSFGCLNSNMYLIKTDSEGNFEWDRNFGGLLFEAAYDLVQTADDGFVLAGFTNSYGAGQYDAYLVKTDSLGIMEWNYTYNGVWSGTQYDGAYSIIQTLDGGFALAGFTSFGYPDMFLVKVDSEGREEWTRSFGGIDSDTAYDIIQTEDEGFALAGFSRAVGSGGSDMLFVKTDSNGTLEWYKTYGGLDFENAYSIIQTLDGGYALAGSTTANEHDMFFVKTNSTGYEEWNCTYGGDKVDGAFALVQTSNYSYVIVGSSTIEPVELFTLNANELWILKINDPSIIEETSFYVPVIAPVLLLVVIIKMKKKEVRKLTNTYPFSFHRYICYN
jgi:hypothetical protein